MLARGVADREGGGVVADGGPPVGAGGVAVGEGVAVRVPEGAAAVVPTDVPGASAPYASPSPYPTGVPYSAHTQANTQVRAGPRARARVLRCAGVTG